MGEGQEKAELAAYAFHLLAKGEPAGRRASRDRVVGCRLQQAIEHAERGHADQAAALQPPAQAEQLSAPGSWTRSRRASAGGDRRSGRSLPGSARDSRNS